MDYFLNITFLNFVKLAYLSMLIQALVLVTMSQVYLITGNTLNPEFALVIDAVYQARHELLVLVVLAAFLYLY
jgi:hypothetical protein